MRTGTSLNCYTVSFSRLDVGSGEGIYYEGYNAILETGEGTSLCRNNLPAWNLGINQKPKGKADSDYTKRTIDPLDSNPPQATFIVILRH